jgi:hypothetical protein
MTKHFDVFNGDADGIIALLQLRLAEPKESVLVTGVKRDIQLLEKLQLERPIFPGDTFTVLDISMEKNQRGLLELLAKGAIVTYADHHKSGEIPEHENLSAHIDLDPNICTALIVDQQLQGQYHLWAITAAYGDNLIAKADALSEQAGLTQEQSEQLKELGTLINYNGYGSTLDDLHYDPADLFRQLLQYSSPFDAISDSKSPFTQLKQAYAEDMSLADALPASYQSDKLRVYELPNTPASRRISGVFGNLLANQNPQLAHAVLSENKEGSLTVSLRAPLLNKQGAGDICSGFATGGGRAAAAGINALPREQIEQFIAAVEAAY